MIEKDNLIIDSFYDYFNEISYLWRFKFDESGLIVGPHHNNETYWKYENGKLHLQNNELITTSLFEDYIVKDNKFIGKFNNNTPIYLQLVKTFDMEIRMHETQRHYIKYLVNKYFLNKGSTIFDIGSYDVNGSHKCDILQMVFRYMGVDICHGPNVDIIIEPYNWENVTKCDYIISGSCLEHVEAPWLWANELYKKLNTNGMAIILLPFKLDEHRYPVDCYRILPDGLKYLFCNYAGLQQIECGFTSGNTDTYIVVKKI